LPLLVFLERRFIIQPTDTRSDNDEEGRFEGKRMPGLRWHRISKGEATRAAEPPNLSGTML
jgi:hypothetical protein